MDRGCLSSSRQSLSLRISTEAKSGFSKEHWQNVKTRCLKAKEPDSLCHPLLREGNKNATVAVKTVPSLQLVHELAAVEARVLGRIATQPAAAWGLGGESLRIDLGSVVHELPSILGRNRSKQRKKSRVAEFLAGCIIFSRLPLRGGLMVWKIIQSTCYTDT